MLLLDTCALLMLAGRREDIPDKVIKKLTAQADELFISTISSFEIVLKNRLGKLGLPMSAEEWYCKAVEGYAIEEIPVSSAIAMKSASLPFLHKDPCDRIIIATALEHRMPIITADQIIPQYAGIKVIW
ncbi:PIN domain nuclease, a component of toxin-antitoxin system (PIN domain) [Candidatus Electrothrix aarhusensis]|uniref:PIN domain nuclease, a component of toxin-antitoxin system (PIN domain) n=1 Tax=Candidatus Electrothrix aarhusensis TaxID=1859131 RepID=A0A444IZG2_9BACT|nr:PIN domain nuclease, a component of toxin-antitoxin system (PIN domain) [Candidatus Electrothrix aarhusensis]